MQPDRTVPLLNLHDTPLLVDVGSNDFVSAGLADEWLQARNALSIEIFLQDTLFRRSPRHLRLKARQLRHRGNLSPPRPPCVAPAFVNAVQRSYPTINAEDVRGDQARLVTL